MWEKKLIQNTYCTYKAAVIDTKLTKEANRQRISTPTTDANDTEKALSLRSYRALQNLGEVCASVHASLNYGRIILHMCLCARNKSRQHVQNKTSIQHFSPT